MFYLSIVLAGGCGALLRYLLGLGAVNLNFTALPFGTLLVNVLGSFLIGYLSWNMLHRWQLSQEIQVVVISGFLGGFTTFSAFSLEVIKMLDEGMSGRALIYVVISVGLSISMCLFGLMLARQA